MKPWQSILLGFFIGIICTGLLFLVFSQPRGEPIKLLPSATPEPIRVYITGAIKNPGVYSVLKNDVLSDLIRTAGGLTTKAEIGSLNLAQPLSDGEKYFIPDDTYQPEQINKNTGPVVSTIRLLININTADQDELSSLPGIGKSKATDIINYRKQYGFFSKIEDIQNVSGIGPGIYDKIKGLICVQ